MKLMVSPSILGATTGVGMALLIGISLVIYRYYSRDRKQAEEDAYFAAYRERTEASSLRGGKVSAGEGLKGAQTQAGELLEGLPSARYPQQARGKLVVLADSTAHVMASPPQQRSRSHRLEPFLLSRLYGLLASLSALVVFHFYSEMAADAPPARFVVN